MPQFHHWEKASQIKDSVWTQRDPNVRLLACLPALHILPSSHDPEF